jgi:hypothetical protein
MSSELSELLQRIRHIAGLDEEEALNEVARLRTDIFLTPSLEHLRSELDNIRKESAALLGLVEGGTDPDPIRLEELRRRAIRELGNWWPQPIQEELLGDIQEARQLAIYAIDEAEYSHCLTTLRRLLVEPITNNQQAPRILRQLWDVEELITKRQGTPPEVHRELRVARERAARYRWREKMNSAEVAMAGSKEKRSAQLRDEALVLLRQDWERAFPQELPPAE